MEGRKRESRLLIQTQEFHKFEKNYMCRLSKQVCLSSDIVKYYSSFPEVVLSKVTKLNFPNLDTCFLLLLEAVSSIFAIPIPFHRIFAYLPYSTVLSGNVTGFTL